MDTKNKKPIVTTKISQEPEHIFSGSIYLFYGFDMGDDVDLEKVKALPSIHTCPRTWPKHFKHFHTPLTIELCSSQTPDTARCLYANIHHFGAVSIIYKIPFKGSLETLQSRISKLNEQYKIKSTEDASYLLNQIKDHISHAKTFHHRNSYVVTHIEPQTEQSSNAMFIKQYGPTIASALRFEKQTISEFQMKEILQSTTGYYKRDLVIIDTEAAFVYDKEPEELLDFFEQALIQQLQLQYFDKLLDSKLDSVYNQTIQKPSPYSYLPFIGTLYDPLSELSKLKVEISVITERLTNSIKLAGEPYYSKVYDLLVKKLEINTWKTSVDEKLEIIRDVRSIYQNKVNSIREDLLSTLIIVLIVIELLVAIIK